MWGTARKTMTTRTDPLCRYSWDTDVEGKIIIGMTISTEV